MLFMYEFPKASLTTDIVVCHFPSRRILLVYRKNEPIGWGLPGGFLEMNETLLECAQRELLEETGITPDKGTWIQSTIADKIYRDKRDRVISVVYEYHIYEEDIVFAAADDAADCKLFEICELPALVFDHDEILERIGILSPAFWTV